MSTYTPITTTVLTSTASSVTFNSIPQNYTDLRIVISAKMNTTTGQLYMLFNGDGGTNYSRTMVWNNGTSYGSNRDSTYSTLNIDYYGIVSTDRFNTQILDLMQYSNTNITKNCLFRNVNTEYGNDVVAGLWNNTNAITQIVIYASQTLAIGSTFSLYGIAAGGGYATGGNTVTTDGTYWYHTFLSSGAFVPTRNLTNVDYLVVAGGGGGGRENFQSGSGGGGGAGGLRSTVTATGGGGSLESKLSLTANTSYQVIVGSGGAGYTGDAGTGSNGSDSVFSTITSAGGGGGGGGTSARTSGMAGGSGGGAASNTGTTTYGEGTANQGYRGGSGGGGLNNAPAGGGGGAGAVGGNSTSTDGGAGGAGVAVSISGSSVTYAGGGGGCSNSNSGAGGAGGAGGGGTGATYTSANATAGAANTGGGAGGSGNGGSSSASRAGGSGIVIVRYAV
jgi:hypothetical protein